ncbi:glycosyltransferase family 9 protein [Marinomonas sp. 15G1-11]|uniref:Glycosyltransferase family 9 protein n=1 Tax=Marinomonas phaeophyticola TaxID=3004091 RepID=A0ABT4JYE4_9GAMM|nr:glycosyltransferase family 9 protein [Marinomonas sp. 15G1-11]MCZ2722778.1 glycosyltransferase family 9 protein [Marinomonas sp. 15G1-11]
MNLDKINHIAILRLSALGDVCHAMFVVCAIKQCYPNAKITWITGPLESHLVRHLSDVDVHVYDKKTGIKGMYELRKALSHLHFDVLLHMQWSLRASCLSRMISAKQRIGFALSHSREKQHWFVNKLAPEPQGPHVLDALFSLAQAIGVTKLPSRCDIQLERLAEPLPERFVAINPSASKAERNWTTQGYQGLIQYCLDQNIAVVLTGSPAPSEVFFANEILKGVTPSSELINLVGQTSLSQMLSVIGAAEVIVSPDTGPAHMGTLVGTPVIGLYAHSNPQRTGPYQDLDKVVSVYEVLAEKEYAKPVSELPWAVRVHDDAAMNNILLEDVLKVVGSVLK